MIKEIITIRVRGMELYEDLENVLEEGDGRYDATFICKKTGKEINMDYILQGGACYQLEYAESSDNRFWCPFEVDMFLAKREGHCEDLELVINKYYSD